MRHHTTLIGWPRRDPRRYRFPLPNTVWEYELKPIEFVLLSYLCYHHSHGGTDSITPEVIAAGIHKTVNTVKKHLVSLTSKRLITQGWSPTPNVQCSDGKKFFTMPNEVFLLGLPTSAFMVYAYLLLIEDRRTHTCHPSYNTIAAATGMSKNTVLKSISVLLESGLITMKHSSYFDGHGMKWKGNNLYTILPTRAAVDMFHQRQLRQVNLNAECRRIRKRQEEYDRRHPRTPLCASVWPSSVGDGDNPPPTTEATVSKPCGRSAGSSRGLHRARASQRRPVGANAYPSG